MMRGVWMDFKRENMFHLTTQMISHHLLKNGISFEKNGNEFEPKPDVKDAFEEYWIPFTLDCINCVIALGFAVVIMQKDETGRKYPEIVPPHLYRLTIEVHNNKKLYVVSST